VYKLTANGSSVAGTVLCYEGGKLRSQCPLSGSIEGGKIVLSMDLAKTNYSYDKSKNFFNWEAGDMIKFTGTINNEGKSITGRYEMCLGGKTVHGNWTARKR
jgi:hypothetical protein